MALLDDFKARFPEFGVADADRYIPILETVWPEYFGKPYADNKEAVLNLNAHLMVGEISTSKESAQIVSSESVGSVSTSYASPTHEGGALYDFFNSTKYGQRFWMLTKNKRGGVAV